MNEMTKLIVTFLAGLVVGVLAATSTLFQGESEPAPTEIVTPDTGRETAREAGQRSARPAEGREPIEQAAAEPEPDLEPSEQEAEAPQAQAEPDLVEAESRRPGVEDAEQGAGEDEEPLPPAAQEADEKIFCMQMESTGQCRCYDAETMAPAEVSPEACRERLAEE